MTAEDEPSARLSIGCWIWDRTFQPESAVAKAISATCPSRVFSEKPEMAESGHQ